MAGGRGLTPQINRLPLVLRSQACRTWRGVGLFAIAQDTPPVPGWVGLVRLAPWGNCMAAGEFKSVLIQAWILRTREFQRSPSWPCKPPGQLGKGTGVSEIPARVGPQYARPECDVARNQAQPTAPQELLLRH